MLQKNCPISNRIDQSDGHFTGKLIICRVYVVVCIKDINIVMKKKYIIKLNKNKRRVCVIHHLICFASHDGDWRQ